MAKYIIAGGTGFVGNYLVKLLVERNHTITILTTQKGKKSTDRVNYVYWNPTIQHIDNAANALEGVLINLAGAGVADKRWTNERKKLIINSRIDSLNTLFKAAKDGRLQISKLVSASAIGYYGDGSKHFVEDDLGDDSFLSSTCKQWEAAALQFQQLDINVTIARIGIVLGKEGGALKAFLEPVRFGIAGIPASGKQIYSWIAVQDLAKMLSFLADSNMNGVFNAVATNPCTINKIFEEIKKHYPVLITAHAPSIILKLLLGEMAVEVLKSTSVSNEKIRQAGFVFQFHTIEDYFAHLSLKK